MREEIKKLGIEFHQKLVNQYIDNAFFYYEENIDEIKNHLTSLYNENPALIPTFNLAIDGIEISKTDAIDIIKQFINDCIVDYDIYIYEVVSSFNKKRFNTTSSDPILSVKNKYGDKVYYNQRRLDFLRNRYGKIKDHEIRAIIKKEKKSADCKRNVFKRLGAYVASDYSYAYHLEYKYYISLFEREFNIKDSYYNFSYGNYDDAGRTEYTEYRIDELILENNITRTRK